MKRTTYLTLMVIFAVVFVLLAVGTLSATTMTGTTEQQRVAAITGATDEASTGLITMAKNEAMKTDAAAATVLATTSTKLGNGQNTKEQQALEVAAMEMKTNLSFYVTNALYQVRTFRHANKVFCTLITGAGVMTHLRV